MSYRLELHQPGAGSIKPTVIVPCETLAQAIEEWVRWSNRGYLAQLRRSKILLGNRWVEPRQLALSL